MSITPRQCCQTLNYLGYTGGMADSRTRWLSAEEQSAWRAFLAASQTLFSAVEAQLQRESGIPHGYYEILVNLSEAPDRSLRMSQLAEASTSSKSRLSHAVARLEERGWVERLDCPTDRRGQVARLTDAGFAALEAAAPAHVRAGQAIAIRPDQPPSRSRSSPRSAPPSPPASRATRTAARAVATASRWTMPPMAWSLPS